jgi:hypothetical protein
MVPYPSTSGATYIRVGSIASGECAATATIPIGEDYPIFRFDVPHIDEARFSEEKEHNEGERVLNKGTSTRRELKKLPNRTGYKARKEFWR